MSAYRVNEGAIEYAHSYEVTGTAGAGFIGVTPQTSAPTPPTGARVYANSSGELSWITNNGFAGTLDLSGLSEGRSWQLPDVSEPLVTASTTTTFTNKTISSTGNLVDATHLLGEELAGVPENGDILAYNGTWGPLELQATSPVSYSGGTISISTGTTSGTVALGDDARFMVPQLLKVKNSNPGADEFTSIAAALSSISDSGPTKPYLVIVFPGIYSEPAMTIPQYTTLTGAGFNSVTAMATTDSGVLFTMSSYSVIKHMTVLGLGGTADIGVLINNCNSAVIQDSVITSFNTLVKQTATSSDCSALITGTSFTGTFATALHLDGRNITGANRVAFSMSSGFVISGASAVACILAEGPHVTSLITNFDILGAVNGIGVCVRDGADLEIGNSRVKGCDTGMSSEDVGVGPLLRCRSLAFLDNITADLLIAHTGTTGVFDGVADSSKVTIDATEFSSFFTDSATPGTVTIGDSVYAPFNSASRTEIGALTTYTAPIGKYSGGSISADAGMNVTVSAGVGYLSVGSFPTQQLIKAEWDSNSLSFSANTTNYVYVDSDSTVVSAISFPVLTSHILLGRVRTTATDIEFIDTQRHDINHIFQRQLQESRDISGAIYASGSMVTANASRELAVSSGKYYYQHNQYNPTGASSPTNWYAYYHDTGAFVRAAETVVSNTEYDDGSDLISIPAGKYVKHALYIVGEGTTEQYFLVYGQEVFDTEQEATSGTLPTPPNYFTEGVILISAIIVLEGSAAVVSVIDMRPTVGGSASVGSGSVTDHGDLTGLLDDDHPQYALTSGSRAFTGDIDLGANNITNVGLVDGVVVSAHASRHLPNGSDALTTAAPLTSLSSATTNAVGTANSYARSDHTHAIDITGFNLNNLTGTLDVSRGGTGASALTAGRFLVGNGTSAVDLSKVAPTGVVVGTTDTQTLSGKTLLSADNTIEATSVRAVAVDSTAPTAGQILAATSGTAATWTTLTDSLFSGVLEVSHGGTGASTLTASRFLVGNGTTAVDLSKVVPLGDVVGTTDTQTLTGKTLSSTGNTVDATHMRTITISATAPTAGQALVATSSTDAAWGEVTDTSFSGVLGVTHGGTGVSALTASRFLVGDGVSAVDLSKVVPAGVVVGTTDTQTLSGKTLLSADNTVEATSVRTVALDSTAPTAGQVLVATSGTTAEWGELTDTGFSGVLEVTHGGTGASALTASRFLVGNGTSAVDLSKVVPTGDIVGTTDTQTLTGKTLSSTGNTVDATHVRTITIGAVAPTAGQTLVATSGTDAAWGEVTDTSFSGTLGVPHGGTGASTLTASRFLVGNGTTAVDLSKVVPAGVVVGTTDTQTLSGKTLLSADNTVEATSVRTVAVDSTAPTAGQVLVATSGTTAEWGELTDTGFSGTLGVTHGGTGQSALTASRFLVGNGTSAVDLSKVVPAGVVVGTSDTQTLTNKAILSATNVVEAVRIRTVSIGTNVAAAGKVIMASSSVAADWELITDSSFSGILSVSHGGTGASTLTASRFLVGNGTSAVDLSKVVPAGAVVGTTDTQTLTGKTLSSTSNTVDATHMRTITIGAVAPTAGQVLVASSSTDAAWGELTDTGFSGTLGVPHGGTGASTLTASRFLVGNGTSAVDLSKVVPAGVVVGTTDTQTLTGKTITGGSSGNDIAANKILGVAVDVTAPTAGQILAATTGTTAEWTALTDSLFSGVLGVSHGGTGASTLTASRFLVGNGTSAVDLSKVVPAGAVVGTTDTQTLTGKTLSSTGNTVDATHMRTITIGATTPSAGQVLAATSGTAADWTTLTDSLFSGVLGVTHGGTGASTLTASRFLVGNGTSAVDLSKVVPTGDVVGTTDTQTLTGKTLSSTGNTVDATHVRTITIGATTPSAGQVLAATSSTAADWTALTDSLFSGVLGVSHGGTGASTLTASRFLVGNGTSAVDLSKVVPTGAVVGTTDTQTLTGKTLSSTGNTVDANQIQTIPVASTTPAEGDALVYNSTTTQWEPGTPGIGSDGVLPYDRYYITDEKTVGTNGGSITADAWTTRALTNITSPHSGTDITLASDTLTITPGVWGLRAVVPGYRIGMFKSCLRDMSTEDVVFYGTSSYSASADNAVTYSVLEGMVQVMETGSYQIQQICTTTRSGDGLGVATGILDTNEIYTTGCIVRLTSSTFF